MARLKGHVTTRIHKRFGECRVLSIVVMHGQEMYKLKPIQPILVERKWKIGNGKGAAPVNVPGYLYDLNKIMNTHVYVPILAVARSTDLNDKAQSRPIGHANAKKD